MNAPGGQAGSSSKIENYLGFPNGISGQDLSARAYNQAQKFGAGLVVAKQALELSCDRRPYGVVIDGGRRLTARTIVIASGAQYRKPDLAELDRFEGAGVYYGATYLEAQLCGGEEVIVVGGGNWPAIPPCSYSTSKHVHVLVSEDSPKACPLSHPSHRGQPGDYRANLEQIDIARWQHSPRACHGPTPRQAGWSAQFGTYSS
jgi:thioredoxin reductase (NADPH)